MMFELGLGIVWVKFEFNFEDLLLVVCVLVKDWVIINVGGYCYEMYLSMLRVVLDLRLVWIVENVFKQVEYDLENNEYFFDCYFGVFVSIINYYWIGKFYIFSDVCGLLFEEELVFWGIDEF